MSSVSNTTQLVVFFYLIYFFHLLPFSFAHFLSPLLTVPSLLPASSLRAAQSYGGSDLCGNLREKAARSLAQLR